LIYTTIGYRVPSKMSEAKEKGWQMVR